MNFPKSFLLILLAAVMTFGGIYIIATESNAADEQPAKQQMRPRGLIPPDRDFWEANVPKFKPKKSGAKLPSHLDWRDVSGKDFTTTVKNQGYCGACASFAAVSVLESLMEIKADKPEADYDLSEQHLFSCAGGTCYYGIDEISILDYLYMNGTPLESCYPYYSGVDGQDRSCGGTCDNWENQAQKINYYSWVQGHEAIKEALQDGPVVAGMEITWGFELSYSGGIYQGNDCSSPSIPNHGVALVGYDDTDQYWIAKNSWSPYWGEGGFFKIAYGKCAIEDYVLRLSYVGTPPDDDDDDTADDDDDNDTIEEPNEDDDDDTSDNLDEDNFEDDDSGGCCG